MKKIILYVIVVLMATILSGCYTQQRVMQVKTGIWTDTLYFDKEELHTKPTFYLGKEATDKLKYIYKKTSTYPIRFQIEEKNNIINYYFNSCDTCKLVTLLKTHDGEHLVPTDLQYEQYSFWKTMGLFLMISVGVSTATYLYYSP